jgi:hypothetical protein
MRAKDLEQAETARRRSEREDLLAKGEAIRMPTAKAQEIINRCATIDAMRVASAKVHVIKYERG